MSDCHIPWTPNRACRINNKNWAAVVLLLRFPSLEQMKLAEEDEEHKIDRH
jgi:hypothetical protein